MKKKGHAFIAAAVLIWGLPPLSHGAYAPDAEEEIRNLLDVQVQAWNRGDLVGFMAFYWKSPDMTFQSGGRRLYGWDTLLERYRTEYAGEKMGTLRFEDLRIHILSESLAYALGRYRLRYPDSEAQGVFTIILRRLPEGWRIIHDHSSA
jgi:beta-aspartyl-peptidase (threonine type)